MIVARNGRGQNVRPIDDLFDGQSFWYCEACRAHGPAVFGENESVAGACDKIRDAHAKASPKCKNPSRSLRVVDAVAFATLETRQ